MRNLNGGLWFNHRTIHVYSFRETPEPGKMTATHLFDLSKDIGEKTDLASTRPNEVRELQMLWDRWNAEQAPPAREEGKGTEKR